MAVIFEVVLLVTAEVVIVKDAEDEPDGIISVAGTWTLAELLDKTNMVPPAGAGLDRATIARDELPPSMVAGLRLSETTLSGMITRLSVMPTPFAETAMTVDRLLATEAVLTTKLAELAPAGITKELGA